MGNWQNQLIMLKLQLFPRDSGKDAVLGPPKLPLGLRPSGSFGGPRTASFPESLEKRWSLGPICRPRAAYFPICRP